MQCNVMGSAAAHVRTAVVAFIFVQTSPQHKLGTALRSLVILLPPSSYLCCVTLATADGEWTGRAQHVPPPPPLSPVSSASLLVVVPFKVPLLLPSAAPLR